MGMYLMRQIGRDGHYHSDLPDFMVFLDWKTLPWHWTFSDSLPATLLLIVAVPGIVAFVFGYFAFRSRIKGVYFSIITQALTFAAMLLFFRNETGFGGNNGFTDFKRIAGIAIATPQLRMDAVRADGRHPARLLPVRPFPGGQQVRPRAAGDPRRRVARHVLRLLAGGLQAGHLDAQRDHVRRRRRVVRAAGGHHQSRRDESRQLHRDRDLGRGGWAALRWWVPSSAPSSSTAPRAG
jgi:hypothetical protein